MSWSKSVTTSLMICTACVLSAPAPAGAVEAGNMVFHGSLSQSYLKSEGNNYLIPRSKKGRLDWNELTFNATAFPTDDLSFGFQLNSRDMGTVGNHTVRLDWAQGDYHWRDWLGLRAGKVKFATGLYSDSRMADQVRVPILLPSSIYPEAQRELMSGILGVALYGVLLTEGLGDFEYELTGGTMELDDTNVTYLVVMDASINALPLLRFDDQASVVIDGTDSTMRYSGMLNLRWYTPLDGLRLGLTAQRSESRFFNYTTYRGMRDGVLTAVTTSNRTFYKQPWSMVASGEYQWQDLTIAVEYWNTKTTNHVTGTAPDDGLTPAVNVRSTSRINAAYGQVGYRFTDWFQVAAYYSMLRTKRYRNGEQLPERADGEDYRDSVSLTLRFDPAPGWLFKLQAEHNKGTVGIRDAMNREGLEESWQMYAARMGFYF